MVLVLSKMRNYQEDEEYQDDILSDIFPLQDKSTGRKKSHVWDYFETYGEKKHGHVGCVCRLCGWKRAVGKAYEMVEHLALSCSGTTAEVKNIFLQEIRDKSTLKSDHHPPPDNNNSTLTKKVKTQKKITAIFESNEIEKSKIVRVNKSLTRLFVCCAIPFRIVSNPFL